MAYEGFAEDPDTYRSNGDKYSILEGLSRVARYRPMLSIRLTVANILCFAVSCDPPSDVWFVFTFY